MAKKFWRLIALVPDTVAHDVMSMIAGRGYVESFVPAITGPGSEEGNPREAITSTQFIAQYIAENPHFKNKALIAAAVEAGLSKSTVTASIYGLKNRGELIHIGPGEFAVKGHKISKAAKPAKTNGAKPGRAPKGAAEAAVLERVKAAKGQPVDVPTLQQAVTAAGGSPRSISGVIARLIEGKHLKRTDQRGHYIAA